MPSTSTSTPGCRVLVAPTCPRRPRSRCAQAVPNGSCPTYRLRHRSFRRLPIPTSTSRRPRRRAQARSPRPCTRNHTSGSSRKGPRIAASFARPSLDKRVKRRHRDRLPSSPFASLPADGPIDFDHGSSAPAGLFRATARDPLVAAYPAAGPLGTTRARMAGTGPMAATPGMVVPAPPAARVVNVTRDAATAAASASSSRLPGATATTDTIDPPRDPNQKRNSRHD